MVPNAMLDRAHSISNRYALDEYWHMQLINLLNAAYDLGWSEGFNDGETSRTDAAIEAINELRNDDDQSR